MVSRRMTPRTEQVVVRVPVGLLAEVRELGGAGRSLTGSMLMMVRAGVEAIRGGSALGGMDAGVEDRSRGLVGEIEGVLRG